MDMALKGLSVEADTEDIENSYGKGVSARWCPCVRVVQALGKGVRVLARIRPSIAVCVCTSSKHTVRG